MARRRLRADISRELIAHVYIEIDDEKVELRNLNPPECSTPCYLITGEIRRLVEAEAGRKAVRWDDMGISISEIVEAKQVT